MFGTLSECGILTSRGKEPNHTLFVTSLPSIIITSEKIVYCLIHIQALEKEEKEGGGGVKKEEREGRKRGWKERMKKQKEAGGGE